MPLQGLSSTCCVFKLHIQPIRTTDIVGEIQPSSDVLFFVLPVKLTEQAKLLGQDISERQNHRYVPPCINILHISW
jgi:hypothetical protein